MCSNRLKMNCNIAISFGNVAKNSGAGEEEFLPQISQMNADNFVACLICENPCNLWTKSVFHPCPSAAKLNA